MANAKIKVQENVSGKFFVDNTCINCDACRRFAPNNFADQGDYSFVSKQPENEIEEMENYESMSELRVSETPETTMMSNQIAATVNSAIQNLPDELREAISLREIDGLCYEEIAELMDCPIGTVRSRIFRARETIAEKLKPLIETTNKRW